MTFSIAGLCRVSGMFGAAVTTSSPAVGNRCPFARAGVGAVLTQHRTDPRLGPRGLDLLAAGKSAAKALAALTEGDSQIGWRQLAVVDRAGRTAHFHGDRIASVHGAAHGDGCVAIGNILAAPGVPAAMAAAFERAAEAPLAERLLRGLEAGLAAGGEVKQVKSAALLVVDREVFPLVDLRVDLDPAPVPRLRFLWELYEPFAPVAVIRALDPDNAPPA